MADQPVTFKLRVGLRANLPAAGYVAGEPFFCEDTGEFFVWTGSVMQAVGGSVVSVAGKVGIVTLNIGDITGLTAELATFALESDLTSEASTRASADTTLASAITSEASARATAVSNEASTRASADTTLQGNIDAEATARATADALLVPETTTVNGHALSSNVIVSASDITTGTLPHAQLPSLVSGDIPNNAANTSGTAGGLSANITESQVTNLTSDLALKAPLASPTFTGTVSGITYTMVGADASGAAAAAQSTAEGYTDSQITSRAVLLAPLADQTITAHNLSLTGAGAIFAAPVVNATTGFEISGAAATAGHVLRANGTNYVDAQLQYGDIGGTTPTPPSGAVLWSALGNAAADLTLANAGFKSTFNQTSAAAWLWANTTTATSGTTNASPLLELAANYWTGSASSADTWTIGSSLAAGTNGISTLTISHSGSSNGQSGVHIVGANTASTGKNGLLVVDNGSSAGNILTLTSNSINISYQCTNSIGYFGTTSNNAFAIFTNNGNGNLYLTTDGGATVGPVAGAPGQGNLAITGGLLAFTAGTASTTKDSGISRLGAASLAIGNGTGGDNNGALSLSRLNAFSSDLAGSVSSAPSGIVAATVVVAVGAATATFTVTSTEGFTVGDTVTLSAGGWTGGSGLASTTATVASITNTTAMVLTYVSGGPWVAGTYTAQTGTLAQTGGTSVTVTYKTAYTNTPFVMVTPTSNCGAWYISAQSTGGFTITYATSGTQTFNYSVVGNQS